MWTYLCQIVNVGRVQPWQKTSSQPQKGSSYAKQPTKPSSINTGAATDHSRTPVSSQSAHLLLVPELLTGEPKSLASKPHTMELAPFQVQEDDSLSKIIILWGG